MKMKRISTYLVALSITIVSIFSTMLNVNATEINEEEYINNVIEVYLESNDISNQNVKISQAFDYYNLASGKANGHEYVVYATDTAKGFLYVNRLNDKFYSSFRLSATDLADELSCENAETAFGYYDDSTVLISDEKFYNSDSGDEITNINELSNNVITKKIKKRTLSINKKNTRSLKKAKSRKSYNCSLNVTPVSNASINGGICWAASIAAKHNYEYGNSVTAESVYYTVAGCTGNSSPNGTSENTQLGLACFGLSSTYKPGALNIHQVYKELSHNNPIVISVDSDEAAHSLVLCGVTYNGTTGTYTFADSNFASRLTVYVDSAAAGDGSNFVYTSDVILAAYNCSFTRWYQTYSYEYA